MVHCSRRGTEAIVGDIAHGFLYEQGGAAQIAGVLLNTIKNNPDGTFCLNELVHKFRGFDIHEPNTVLVMVENTHNMCGGKVLPLDWLERLATICREKGAKVHMDGARVFNAAAHLNLPVSRIVRDVDSVCFCLSKGLACPVGSILLGTKEFIKEAHRLRKALGGGMRQVGFLAAAG
uniref:Aromatic amino acid beta-eliminating lyase/threonine aldolase domain-containing protein n=1 Tax=Anopheles maculatus TaxID=74869 RepID=A0A182TBA9_9DIPT